MKYSPWSKDAALVVLATLREEEGPVLMALQALQNLFGYIDKEAVGLVATYFNKSRADVHGVLTFYHDLRTSPSPENQISICVAEACQAVGSRDLEKQVKAKFGNEVHDGFCFGNCALGPSAMVNGCIIGRASLDKIAEARQ
ncbi:MAG: NAD(P)H-dependent oxidoreductase subunit E [Actinomycetes bacterium]